MKVATVLTALAGVLFFSLVAALALGQSTPLQTKQEPKRPDTARIPQPEPRGGFGQQPPPFGPDGSGFGGRGPGGPGGQQKLKLVEKFDKNADKILNAAERKAAREFLAKEGGARKGGPGGPRGPGGPGGQFGKQEPALPGAKLSPADVKSFPEASLFDATTLRTFFFEFENADWEKELADFKNTDVHVPAKLTVDGKTYRDVGVHFRGMSSFMTVPEGRKRSLALEMDFAHKDQQFHGYRNLNLLNSHEDPSLLRTVLYNQIAREFIPAPKANFVRVVINGESWGVYVSAQQFDKDFVQDWFKTAKGARWKVQGSPGGRGGLNYLGDDSAAYKRIYSIKSKDEEKSWAALIKLCRVLNETPADKLEAALKPLLDMDGALKFLALENVFINNDGYWIRSSDYNLYLDTKGRFHIVPHDSNETFATPGGPGFGGGPGGPGFGGRPAGAPEFVGGKGGEQKGQPQFGGGQGFGGNPGGKGGPGFGPPDGSKGFGGGPRINGVELDPLIGANDSNKPLLSKLLAVPALRARYLGYVREMSEKWLDWNKLGPVAQQFHDLIAADVKTDTRKLDSFEDFERSLKNAGAAPASEPAFRGPRRAITLKDFAEQRRAYLAKKN